MKKKVVKKDKKKPSTDEKLRVQVPFDHDRYKEIGSELTRTMELIGEKDLTVKAVVSAHKAEIKALTARVDELANQMRNGYEEKEVDVYVQFDRKAGRKSYFHEAPGQPHHGEFIREADMTEADYQLLPFEGSSATVPLGGEKPTKDTDKPGETGDGQQEPPDSAGEEKD